MMSLIKRDEHFAFASSLTEEHILSYSSGC